MRLLRRWGYDRGPILSGFPIAMHLNLVTISKRRQPDPAVGPCVRRSRCALLGGHLEETPHLDRNTNGINRLVKPLRHDPTGEGETPLRTVLRWGQARSQAG